jgi:UDP-N-acetylglucosamine 3-dehydrogenase
MNSPRRLAFVGIDHPHGHGWRETLRTLEGDVEITAIVPGFNGGLTSLEERLAEVPRFETVGELIAGGEFEAAIVCLPNSENPAALVELAEAGKHLLAEKPAAASADEFRPVVDAVAAAGVAFQSGYMWRYDECATRLKQMVAEGRCGKLISQEITFVTSDVERRGPQHYVFDKQQSGAGFFNWLACHSLDLLLYITGQSVTAVTARTGVFGETPCEVEDGGAAILDLDGGGIATFVGGYWIPRWAGEFHWTLRGSQRWVHWDPTRAGTGGVLEIHGPKPQWIAMEETFAAPVDDVPGYGGRNGQRLMQDWLNAINTGRESCRNTPESTLQTLEIIDAIYESSRKGRRVELRPSLD